MAASIEQKVDYLLKKIGYTASKTGIAEDESSLTGTKKAPFAEALPSPLVVPATSIYGQSEQIPATPPGATSGVVEVYGTASAFEMTEDNTVAGQRSWLARSVAGNNSSAMEGDWIDTQFGSDYIINVYAGDPNSGGTKLSAAGSGSNDTWFFDYSSGVLNFNGTNVPTAVTGGATIYLVGYRYTGTKGLNGTAGSYTSITASSYFLQDGSNPAQNIFTVSGTDVSLNGVDAIDATTKATLEASLAIAPNEFNDIVVSGLSTFNGTVDLNADIIGSGNIVYTGIGSITAGVATFGQATLGAGSTMEGMSFIETLRIADGLEVSGVTTFKGDVSFEGTSISGTIDQAGRAFRLDAPATPDGNDTTFAMPLVETPGIDTSFVTTREFTFNPGTGIMTAPSAVFTENVDVVGVLTAGTLKVDNPLEDVVITDVVITGDAAVGGALTVTGVIDANGGVEGNLEGSADKVDVTDVSTANTDFTLTMTDGANTVDGRSVGMDSDLTYNPSTNTLTAGTFSGSLVGTASSANQVLVTPELSSATTHFINFSEQSLSPTDLHRDSSLTYTPSTDTLAATNVSATTLTASGEVEGGSLDINGDGDFSGNVNIAGNLDVLGTLTYEDVTDIDSVGLITARSGIHVLNGGIDVQAGVVTSADGFAGDLTGNVTGNLTGEVNAPAFDTNADGVVVTGVATATGFSGPLVGNVTGDLLGNVTGNVVGDLTGEVNAAAFDTNADGIVVTGVATATLFSGDGSGLSNLNAGIAGLDINPRHVLVGGALTVTGATTAADITSSGTVDAAKFAVSGTDVLQTVNGQVALTGIATLDATTKATIEREIALAPNDFATLNVAGVGTVNGQFDAKGGIDVTGHAELDTLRVSGVATFQDNVEIQGETTLSDLLTTNATIQINSPGALNIQNIGSFDALGEAPSAQFDIDVTFDDGLTVNAGSTASINGDLDVDGHTELDNLNVTGVATFASGMDFNGDLDVDGHTALDDLNVAGVATFSADVNSLAHLTANTFRATGIATFVTDANFDGNIIGDGATNITGINSVTATEFYGDGSNLTGLEAGLDGLNVTLGDVTVGGALTVTGATDINGDIDIDGHAELDELRVSGVSTFVGGATFQENLAILGQGSIQTLVVGGNSSLQDTQVGGGLTVTGATDLNGALDVQGNTNLQADLGVGGTANFSDIAAFQDSVFHNGAVTIANGQSLDVGNILSVNSNGEAPEFTVNNVAADFNAGINVNGAVGGDAGIVTTGDLAGAVTGLDIAPRHINASGVGTFAQGLVVSAGGADITGLATVTGDLYVTGNTTLGDAATDTVTVNADVASNLIPDGNNTRDLGAISDRWANVYSGEINTQTLDVAGNVTVGGNLSVAGTITSAELVELDIIAPVIELGLESVGDGTLQPPSVQTNYSSGTAMWYNRVGVSSDNAQAAAVFADLKPTGTYRIGFATDVTIGDGDTIGAVNGWAEIEAGGLWMNDCAGQSVVINCTGTERFLNNITVDGGTF